MTREEFTKLTSERIVYLDGATGSNLYLAGMPRGVCAEKWILENPQPLQNLQKAYALAGADMVYAPTFGGNRIALAGHGLEDQIEEMNKRLVAVSKEAVGSSAMVAGDITTTGQTLENQGGKMSVDELFDIYCQQIRYLVEAGVDLLGIETMMSVDETVVALDAAMAVCDLPVICTLSLEADGQAMFGGNAVEAVETLQAMGASAVGVNCSVGPDQLESIITNMKRVANVPIIAKPNAGMPFIDDEGKAIYSMGADDFAANMVKLHKAGADILGGCCGTTPDYIKKTKMAIEGKLILP